MHCNRGNRVDARGDVTARAHPTSATIGLGICINSKSSGGGVQMEGIKVCKLEVRGRARREAARRRKSDWKVNLDIRNASRSNRRWRMTPKTVSFSIAEPRGI